jgi:putative tricarboxylic transport membrane protein
LKLSKDGWAGLAVLAASLFLFWLTFELKRNPLVPIGPEFYPRLVLGLSAVLAAALILLDVVRKHDPPAAETPNYRAVVLHFGVFALYVVALPSLGFRIATFLYVAATNALLDTPRTPGGWLRVATLAGATALATYIIFERYLTVLLPRGSWTDF